MLVASRMTNEVRFIVGGLLPHSSCETVSQTVLPNLASKPCSPLKPFGEAYRLRIVQEHGRCQPWKSVESYPNILIYKDLVACEALASRRWRPATFVQRRYALRKFYMVQIHARGGQSVGITSRLFRR